MVLLLVSSCTILDRIPDGTQKIIIRIWENITPNFLADDLKRLDLSQENVIEFDVTHKGSDIYLAYTTDKHVTRILNPVASNPGIIPEITPPTLNDKISYIEEKDVIQVSERHILRTITERRKIRTTPTDPFVELSPRIVKTIPIPLNPPRGVWVRLLKGKKIGIGGKNIYSWRTIFASGEPMDINNIKIVDLANNPDGALIAVTNGVAGTKKTILIQDGNKDKQPDFISDSDLFSQIKFSPTSIRDINTWRDPNSDRTYIAAIFNDSLATGYLKGNRWNETYFAKLSSPNVIDFQVKQARNDVYAIWTDSQTRTTEFLMYNEDRLPLQRWLKIDSLNSVKEAQLSVGKYFDLSGIERESVYVGAVNITQDFFQLYSLEDKQLSLRGPIIAQWNERFSFDINDKNQILYVRVQPNRELIFAGLNSLQEWEMIQRNTPPPVLINPTSELKVIFLEDKLPITFFKQDDGSIYVLDGSS
ncbi:MAG: hypothetical protein ACRCVW_03890 [Brevinema sp.]